MDNDDIDELKERFKFVCLKCGSDKIDVSAESGYSGSEYTGYCPGFLSIGCNSCEDNDFHVSI